MVEHLLPPLFKGRGAIGNADSRFERYQHEPYDDGWGKQDDSLPLPPTEVSVDTARSIITYNTSPDIPFDRSINPYRGCEHGCIYCYARPSHAYLGLSPGLDFERRIFAKADAANLLRKELGKPGYRCDIMAIGSNTDCYQPIERKMGITRSLLQVLAEYQHPISLVTKSALIERDIDILAAMAKKELVEVFISITTLDRTLARQMEPRATAPQRRLETIKCLVEAGIPTGVMVAPVIPALNDAEMESILQESKNKGADMAGYTMLRLPRELAELFETWLHQHVPLKAEHILSIIKQTRSGKLNDTNFSSRMKGQGIFAEMIKQRFRLASKRLGFVSARERLNISQFSPPVNKRQHQQTGVVSRQAELF